MLSAIVFCSGYVHLDLVYLNPMFYLALLIKSRIIIHAIKNNRGLKTDI